MKILVADDNADFRTLAKRWIGRINPQAEVIEAASGREALALVERERPDMALLDYQMPGCTGIQVGRRCQEVGIPYHVVSSTVPLSPGAQREVVNKDSVPELLIDWIADAGRGALSTKPPDRRGMVLLAPGVVAAVGVLLILLGWV